MPRRTSKLGEREATFLPDAFVVDCSVCLPWYIEDEASDFCDSLASALGRAEIWVPPLWRAELVSAVINAGRRKRMTSERRDAVLTSADGLPLRVDDHMPSIAALDALTKEFSLTPYDAVYLELALRRNLPLATLDKVLITAARAANVSVMTDRSIFPER